MKLVYSMAAALVAVSATVAVGQHLSGNVVKASDLSAKEMRMDSMVKPGDTQYNARLKAATARRSAPMREEAVEGNVTVTTVNGVIIDVTGVAPKYFSRSEDAKTFLIQSNSVVWTTQSGHVEIIEDGDNVFMKNPLTRLEGNSWIRGTKEDGKVSFAAGQPLVYNSTYEASICLEWGKYGSGWGVDRDYAETIDFAVDGDVWTLEGSSAAAGGHVIGAYWNDDNTYQGYWDAETVLTLDAEYVPPTTILVEVPEDLETETLYMNYTDVAGTAYNNVEVNVGFDNNDVYIQGLAVDLPTAWVKGELKGTQIEFENLQYVGSYYGSDCWFTGYDNAAEKMTVPTARYNAADKKITFNCSVLINAAPDRVYYLAWMDDVVINSKLKDLGAGTVYFNGFDTAEQKAECTIVDGNEDGKKFTFVTDNGTGAARYTYNGSKDADDYIIFPAVALTSGKTYSVSVDARNEGYNERLEVLVGKASEVSELTTVVIAPADVTSRTYVTFSNDSFTVEESGDYYFAIHAISDADMFYLYVDNFMVKDKDAAAAAEDAPEVATVEEMKALPMGEATLVTNGLTVTFVADNGNTIAEDATGGMMLFLEGEPLTQGTKLVGAIKGEVVAPAVFIIDLDQSVFTTEEADVTIGEYLSLDDLTKPENLYRLVTVVGSTDTPIVTAENGMSASYGDLNIADFFEALGDDYLFPQNISAVTGILMSTEASLAEIEINALTLAPRSEADVNAIKDVTVNTLAELKALESDEERVVTIESENLLVTFANAETLVLEDETGAVPGMIFSGENALATGKKVSGKLAGMYSNGYFIPDFEASEFTAEDIELTPAVLTNAELAAPENAWRLVQVEGTEDNPIVPDEVNGFGMTNGSVFFVDMWDVLPYDYEFPAIAESVTGINFPYESMMMSKKFDLGDEEENSSMLMVVVRSADDIVAGKTVTVVENIAALKDIETEGQEVSVQLNSADGITVTFAGDPYTFVEDATGAMMVWYMAPEEPGEEQDSRHREAPAALKQGDKLSGTIAGTYVSYGMMSIFMIDPSASEITFGTADVTTGAEIPVNEIATKANEFRLVTVKSSEENPFTYDEEMGAWKLGENVYAADMLDTLGWEYEWPTKLTSVTGIIQLQDLTPYDDSDEAQIIGIVCPRSAEDVEGEFAPAEPLTIAQIKALDWEDYQTINIKDVVVNMSTLETEDDYGWVALEDETGAMLVQTYTYNLGNAPVFTEGTKISGKLMCYYYGYDAMEVVMDYSQINVDETVDVSEGKPMTMSEVLNPANAMYLAKITADDDNKIVGDGTYANYGENIFIVDLFGQLGDDYEFPENIATVNGVIIPMDIFAEAAEGDDAEGGYNVYFIPRSPQDITAGTNSVKEIMKDLQDAPVYDLNGFKVADSLKEMKHAAKGIYIVNGKKVLVK